MEHFQQSDSCFSVICSLPPSTRSLKEVLCSLAHLYLSYCYPLKQMTKDLLVEADALEMLSSVGSSLTWKQVSSCSPILATITGGVCDPVASLALSFRDTGVTKRLLLSGPRLKSLVLFSALLALEVHRFLGEANCFPRLCCGSFVASPSAKCLLHNLWKSLTSSSMSSRASSHRPRLGSFHGNLCKDTLLSFCFVLPHTIHRSPGMLELAN